MDKSTYENRAHVRHSHGLRPQHGKDLKEVLRGEQSHDFGARGLGFGGRSGIAFPSSEGYPVQALEATLSRPFDYLRIR